jgi:hypothetical protein
VTRVLVTDGGSLGARSTLAAVRALAAGGYEPWVTTSGARTVASSSRHCAGTVVTARADHPDYPTDVKRAVEDFDFATVLNASDASLVALAAPGHRLVRKDEVSRLAGIAGLPLLPERVLETPDEVLDAAGDLDYPLAVKPVERRMGHGPVLRVENPDQLVRRAADAPLLVQHWVDVPLSAYSGVMHDGKMIAVLAQQGERLWPIDAGTSSYARTVPTDPDTVASLAVMLAEHEGVFQAQFLGSSLIDLNPRVYGSLPLAVKAGLNLPTIYVDALRGISQHVPAPRLGVRYRWLEGDLRHVSAGLRSGRMDLREAARALAPHRGTAHSTESLTDTGPMLSRARSVARDALRKVRGGAETDPR